MTLTLRDYQTECVDAVERAFDAGTRRCGVILPTGAGKTVVFSELIRRWLKNPARRGRVLVLAHREELLDQAVRKLRDALGAGPGAPRVGLVKGQQHNGVLADAVVASVQTLRNAKRRAQLRDVGLIVVDECHHATADSYRIILDHYGAFADDGSDGVRVVGCTATMSRGDKARLADIWPEIVYERDIAWMIRQGYLCGVRGIRVQVPDLDLRRVKRLAGDFSESALGEALEGSLAPEMIAKAYAEHAEGRQGILFAPTVSSAAVIGEAVAETGPAVRLVHGAMATRERHAALDAFREGSVRVLASCMILTEGTDLPMAKVGIMARPTTVSALYVQMAGRVLRPYPGETRATLLDVCGVTSKHSLIAPVDLFGKELDAVEVDDELLQILCEHCGVTGGHDPGCPTLPLTLDDDLDDAAGVDESVGLVGELEAVEVDLFHGSKSAWLRTYAGYWFLPAGRERYIAIVPGEDRSTFDVVWMHAYRHGVSGWVARGVSELSYAQAFAEGNVTREEKMITSRESSWRARRASEKTHAHAARIGLMLDPDVRGGEASDLIARHAASSRIDPVQIQRATAAMSAVQFARVGV